MKEEKKLVPKRRFKGFEGEWKRRRLDEIAEINPSCTLPDFFEYVDLESVVGTELVKTRAINRTEAPSRAQRLAKKDDIFYQTVRPYQRNNYRFSLSKTNYVFSSGYAQIRPSIDSKFLFSKITTKDFVNKVLDRCTGTSFPAISPNDLSSIEFNIPTDGLEQQKIGQFFKLLDKRITNQERKIAKAKALKSAYLTEMFPQEGETVPKRRFKGFVGKWDSYKIKDIFEVTRGNVLPTSKISKTKSNKTPYPVYSSQTQNNGLLGYYSKYLFDTAITWTTDGANAGTVNFRKGKFYSTNVNGVLLSTKGYACKAVAESLNMVAWKYVSKVGNPKLMNNVMEEIEILLPTNMKELQKLSRLFENLDDQIATEERKLAKLKAMKEAYLEEMFV